MQMKAKNTFTTIFTTISSNVQLNNVKNDLSLRAM